MKANEYPQVTDQIWEDHFEVWSDVAINYKGHWFLVDVSSAEEKMI